MPGALETVYGLGRLAFGAGLMAAPEKLGAVLIGDEAREPAVRIGFRIYGTRDVVLGLGTLRAVAGQGDVASWLVAGIASECSTLSFNSASGRISPRPSGSLAS